MQQFLGNPCPYCGKNFTADDDIVVCPECGTPHHRECYKQMGFCANEGNHSETFEWHSAVHAEAAHIHEHSAAAGEGVAIVCPVCKTEVSGNEKYCIKCGASLRQEPVISPEEEFQRERQRIFMASLGEDIGGITAKEACLFVKSNAGYFLPRFKAFSKGVKCDTNFSAFIFSYFYLFYRKMYGLGIGVLIANLILGIPTALLDLVTIQEQYVEMGLLSQIIWEIPHQQELAVFSIISSFLVWAIRIALMMFFNRLYYAKVISSVKTARETLANEKEEVIAGFFKRKGGTSMVIPVILGICSFALSFILAGAIVSSEFFLLPDMGTYQNLFKF